MAAETFESRYAALGGGRFQATGKARVFQNPTGEQIVISAPWGEEMRGGADCFLASPYDADNPSSLEPGYLIGAEEFLDTYDQTPLSVSRLCQCGHTADEHNTPGGYCAWDGVDGHVCTRF